MLDYVVSRGVTMPFLLIPSCLVPAALTYSQTPVDDIFRITRIKKLGFHSNITRWHGDVCVADPVSLPENAWTEGMHLTSPYAEVAMVITH